MNRKRADFVLILVAVTVAVVTTVTIRNSRTKPPTDDEFIDASIKAVELVESIVDRGIQLNLAEQVKVLSKKIGLNQIPDTTLRDNSVRPPMVYVYNRYIRTTKDDLTFSYMVADTPQGVLLDVGFVTEEPLNIVRINELERKFVSRLEEAGLGYLNPEFQDTQIYLYGQFAGRAAIGSDVRAVLFEGASGEGIVFRFYGDRRKNYE